MTAAVLGAGVMYRVLVEGTDPVSIPHAVRFARRLAKGGNGAARWYHLMDEVRDDFPQRYLDLARQYLPEALPKRFGSYEPLQGNLARDGDQAFVKFFAEDYDVSTIGSFSDRRSLLQGCFQRSHEPRPPDQPPKASAFWRRMLCS
ncbi:hypothetical protein [Paenarthrobacter sp. TA1.8]|uniref:hypothetical protein n=1 Tax=Paenarthrobacter sp. TA1.8 TaxID=3400219 RepID=UPI003B437976